MAVDIPPLNGLEVPEGRKVCPCIALTMDGFQRSYG